MKIDPAIRPQVYSLLAAGIIALLIFSPLIKAHLEYQWIDGALRPDAKCDAAITLSEAYNFYGFTDQRMRWTEEATSLCGLTASRYFRD